MPHDPAWPIQSTWWTPTGVRLRNYFPSDWERIRRSSIRHKWNKLLRQYFTLERSVRKTAGLEHPKEISENFNCKVWENIDKYYLVVNPNPGEHGTYFVAHQHATTFFLTEWEKIVTQKTNLVKAHEIRASRIANEAQLAQTAEDNAELHRLLNLNTETLKTVQTSLLISQDANNRLLADIYHLLLLGNPDGDNTRQMLQANREHPTYNPSRPERHLTVAEANTLMGFKRQQLFDQLLQLTAKGALIIRPKIYSDPEPAWETEHASTNGSHYPLDPSESDSSSPS